jgi:hypothetical protein
MRHEIPKEQMWIAWVSLSTISAAELVSSCDEVGVNSMGPPAKDVHIAGDVAVYVAM